jgi:hypothetical protein
VEALLDNVKKFNEEVPIVPCKVNMALAERLNKLVFVGTRVVPPLQDLLDVLSLRHVEVSLLLKKLVFESVSLVDRLRGSELDRPYQVLCRLN